MAIIKEIISTSDNVKNEIVDTNKNNVFAFWESKDEIPAYLELCKKTWYKNIPNCEIHIINYQNIQSYIGNTYNLTKLKKIPLAMQSDIISAAILEKFGGLFLDIDCIVIDDLFEIFNLISKEKLIAFGVPKSNSIHLAVLYSYKPENPIFKLWRIEAQRKLENIDDSYRWDYFGNAIVNPLLKSNLYNDKYYIIERSISGNILESTVLMGANYDTVMEDYKNFYFNEYLSLRPEVLSLVKCGVISLHNSWTPHQYKNIRDIDIFVECKIPIVDILEFAMKNNRKFNHNALPLLEAFLIDELSRKEIVYKSKYFKGMLVLDFKVNSIDFAFDIIENEDGIGVFLVLRDTNNSEEIKNILSKYLNYNDFHGNRIEIIDIIDKNRALEKILDIYELISKIKFLRKTGMSFFNKNLIEDNVFINLNSFSIYGNILFIDGVCIPIGEYIVDYSDIEYTLLIKGKSVYRRSLAKDNKPELSDKYSDSYNVSYDKCWFTTYGYKGINISDIEKGEYILEIEIRVKDFTKTQIIKSGVNISSNSKGYNFVSDSVSNKISIY
ncbi:hypothetical protein HQR03_11320 [Psychrobacter okhotskensis]|uniref:capsular polysaccharide synthesis protein n=1 Tax=Psychrobacter okhotskensis TaxID=212403 RepID=UPI0015665CCB|nr:capsular polysaccharide synthesis protein [Psychrobacter okhotskensis]NRD71124.1 hypothetical protein [Psychrobacter okhotskensis]